MGRPLGDTETFTGSPRAEVSSTNIAAEGTPGGPAAAWESPCRISGGIPVGRLEADVVRPGAA